MIARISTTLLGLLLHAGLLRASTPPDTLWTRQYGEGIAADVVETKDGGLAAIGQSFPPGGGNPRIRLVRTDDEGRVLWDRFYGSDHGYGRNVFLMDDGGFLVCGYEDVPFGIDEVKIYRTDAWGDTLWTRRLGDGGLTEAVMTSDGLLLVGSPPGMRNGALVTRTDRDFNVVWQRVYSPGYNPDGRAIGPASEGGIIVAGVTRQARGEDLDVFLIRTDQNGDSLWCRRYGTETNQSVSAVKELPDGGFAFTGYTTLFLGGIRLWVVRTDAKGDTLWTRTDPDRFLGNAMIATPEGGFLIAAMGLSSSFDLDVLKLGPAGELEWSRQVGTALEDRPFGLAETNDGGLVVCGYADYSGCGVASCGVEKFWIVRLAGERGHLPPGFSRVRNHPNPFAGRTTIEYFISQAGPVDITVTDMGGRLVRRLYSGRLAGGPQAIEWDGLRDNGTPAVSGVYRILLREGGWTTAGRLVLAR